MDGLRIGNRCNARCLLLFAFLFPMSPQAQPRDAQSTVSAVAANPQATLTTMQAAEKQGDLLMAERHYVAALGAYQSCATKSAVLWDKIGVANHHMFALDAAQKSYEMALRLNPHYSEALNNLGAVYHGRRDFKQAERKYKLALKYDPHSAVAYGNLGTAYFADHKYKQGIRAYQRAIASDPKIFDSNRSARVEEGVSAEERIAVNYSLAKVYAQAGKQEEAMDALRKALAAGFKDRKHLMEDRELASLRQTSEFQKMIFEQHLQ